MRIRRIIRHPRMLTSPRLLARALGVRTARLTPERVIDPARDFCFFGKHEFFAANKFQQRAELAEYLPVPWTGTITGGNPPEGKFVVRPLNHQKGEHFRVTENANDYNPRREYISALFPKTREYRLVYVYGSPVLLLRKQVPEGVTAEQPWNHATGSTFQTVNDWSTSPLMRTDILKRLEECPVIQEADIVGVDVAINGKKNPLYVVFEINSCPALTLEDNVEAVAEFIRNR